MGPPVPASGSFPGRCARSRKAATKTAEDEDEDEDEDDPGLRHRDCWSAARRSSCRGCVVAAFSSLPVECKAVENGGPQVGGGGYIILPSMRRECAAVIVVVLAFHRGRRGGFVF